MSCAREKILVERRNCLWIMVHVETVNPAFVAAGITNHMSERLRRRGVGIMINSKTGTYHPYAFRTETAYPSSSVAL